MTEVLARPAATAPAGAAGGTPGRQLMLVLAAVGIVAVVVAEWWYYNGVRTWLPEPGLVVVIDALVALSYVLTGVVVWSARPDSRTGAILYATGLLAVAGNLGSLSEWPARFVGSSLSTLWYVGVGIVVVTYPTGRFRERRERALAVIAVAWTLITQPVTTVIYKAANCADCAGTPMTVGLSTDAYEALTLAMTIGTDLLWLAFAALVVRRWQRSSATARRELRPLWVAGLAVATAQLASSLVGNLVPPPDGAAIQTLLIIPISAIVPISLGYGLVQGRLSQAGVGDFVVQLGDGEPGATLEAAVARTLDDPSLRIAVAVDDGTLVGLDGTPVPPPGPDRQVTTITSGDQTVAVLVHDASLVANPGLLRSVGAATRLALENERLAAEVRAQLDAVRASRARIVEASDVERARIERNLHDGAQQSLVALGLRLRAMADDAHGTGFDLDLRAASAVLDEALAELRELARGIHPTALEQGGLAVAVEALAERAPVPVDVTIPGDRWPIGTEVAAYFVVAEALTNVARHAEARRATVVAVTVGGSLVVEVGDDGRGGADIRKGTGLLGLADRVAATGGRLEIEPAKPHGTVVRAILPLAGE